MAASNDTDDNPVGMNVVPMVDIIFCLCVFFMCSFKFKELEGRFASWLPKDKGNGPMALELPSEIRVAMTWDDVRQVTVRHYGQRNVESDDELLGLIGGAHHDWARSGHADAPVIVDADERVPWDHVINVVNLSKRAGIDKFEFARGSFTLPDAK